MKIEYRKTRDLIPYENNPRKNDEAVQYVANSIKQFGWQQPIVLDKDNVIVAGHTRYKAAKVLGLDEVPVIVASDLTEEQVKAYRIADNKVSDFSIWDNKKLLEELEDIDLFTGFETSELFGEELDEKDNDFLKDIIDKQGKDNLTINYKCRSIDEFSDIMSYIESIKDKYEQKRCFSS